MLKSSQCHARSYIDYGEPVEGFVGGNLGKSEQDVVDQAEHGLPEHIKVVISLQQPQDLQQLALCDRSQISNVHQGKVQSTL